MIRTVAFIIALYTLVSVAFAFVAYNNALKAELSATQAAGVVRLNEASARLRGQMDVYRVLVNIIAQDHRIGAALTAGNSRAVDDTLKNFSLTFGAWDVDLIDTEGRIQASSHPEKNGSFVSGNLAIAAGNRRLGYELTLENGQRLVRFSRGVRGTNGDIVGGVVVSTDLAELEFEWPITPEPFIFFDQTGLSISSNRRELLLLSIDGNQGDVPFPLTAPKKVVGFDFWTFNSKTEAPSEVISLSKTIPQLGLVGQVLLDTSNARSTAILRSWLVLALLGVLGLIGAVMMQQRRRIALETQHSTTLEAHVDARTAELRATQNELVEASKLAALGRLSAGVSHELNQPLAAILNFSENGKKLLQKEKVEDASQNLNLISEQVRRINRIISNLRAFARQEVSPAESVDLVEITTKSLDLKKADLVKAGITVVSDLPAHPVPVVGGRVRLEQVILNLVSNAIDALQKSDQKRVSVSLSLDNNHARLAIGDTGPGIADLDRVFEPFYTTKELGASKGLGMGLALSYGIVTRFGGHLTCANTAEGAQFVLTLPLSDPKP